LAHGLRDSKEGWALYAPRCPSMRNHKAMERLPGQYDDLCIDEEDGTVVLLEAGGGPLRWWVKGGLVTTAVTLGLASLALAMAPWQRGAAIVVGNPQRQGGTELFHSLNSHPVDRGTILTQDMVKGNFFIYVRNSDIFKPGDDIIILSTASSSYYDSLNEQAVVKSVEDGNVILVNAVTKSLKENCYVVVPADPTSDTGSRYHPPVTVASEPDPVTVASTPDPHHGGEPVIVASTPDPHQGGGNTAVKVFGFLSLSFGLILFFSVIFCSKYRTTTGWPNKEGQWMFKPTDGRAVVALRSPNFDSLESGHVVHPGDMIKVIEKQRGVQMQEKEFGDGDFLFLKLADDRGWVVDREIGNDMCFELFKEVDQVWMYEPQRSGGQIPILKVPDIAGAGTGARLHPGDKFKVSEMQAFSDNGILFLKLADGRGWVYDKTSSSDNGEKLCKRIVEEMWEYQPPNGAQIAIRKYPILNGDKTDYIVSPGETFEVDEVVVGESSVGEFDNVLFLKLSDGRGWLFNKHPEIGELCTRVY